MTTLPELELDELLEDELELLLDELELLLDELLLDELLLEELELLLLDDELPPVPPHPLSVATMMTPSPKFCNFKPNNDSGFMAVSLIINERKTL